MARKKLGKYEIIDRIGRGGMAEVYRGYHASLDRYVAVKLLHPFLADDPEFKDRFENEARNVAKLKHPNIVQVYDFEYDAEGESYYMVMELIDGPTLKDRLFELASSGVQVSVGEAIRIVKSAAEALAYAHQRNMIHRDVKPANLMLDDDGRVVLTDFGIAKIVTGAQFTASGGMVGTPAYMAPEQGLGEAGDERSDIYSLGVILFQLATGRLPFDADTPLAIILKHVNEPLPSPRDFAPTLSEDLDQIIRKALTKKPEERYQTSAEFAKDLDHLDDQGIRHIQYDTPTYPPTPPVQIPISTGLTPPQGALPVYDTTPVMLPGQAPVALPGTPGRLRPGWMLGLVAGLVLVVVLALVSLGNDDTPLSGLFGSDNDTPEPPLTQVAGVGSPSPITPSQTSTDEMAPIPVRPSSTPRPTRPSHTPSTPDETPITPTVEPSATDTVEPTATAVEITASSTPTHETPAGIPEPTDTPPSPTLTETPPSPTLTYTFTPSPTETPPSPTLTYTFMPSPTDTPTSPTPTATPPSPSPTSTWTPSPTLTLTPSATVPREQTATAQAATTEALVAVADAFFATEIAKSPTPNITQTLVACQFSRDVVLPTGALQLSQPPRSNDFGNPRLIEYNTDFSFEITLLNNGTCVWPAGATLSYNAVLTQDLLTDRNGTVDPDPLLAACGSQELRTGRNFAQGDWSYVLSGDVDVDESISITFEGTAPDAHGCYYGVWDLLYPNSDVPIGDPLLITIRVWGSSQ